MPGLVIELQADAMNPQVRLTDLLRKARAVSVKLQATEIEEWLGREMNGYANAADVPDYRRFHAELKCVNPVRGLVPLGVSDPEFQDILSSCAMTQGVGEMEALVQSPTGGTVLCYFTPQQEHRLMEAMPYRMRPVQVIAPTAILAALETVRNRILEWALELETRGVVGEGLTFSREERERATTVTHHHNYTTNIGSIAGDSQIQHGTTGSTQSIVSSVDSQALAALVDSLMRDLDEMRLGAERRAEMVAELATLRAQATSSKPKASIVKESLATVRHIVEASAAHLLVSHGPAIAAILARL